MPNTYQQLVSAYPLISDQISKKSLAIIMRELHAALLRTSNGSVVEFGCYSGTTTLFLRRLLDLPEHLEHSRQLHAYDSFEGLPAKSLMDSSSAGEQFVAGKLRVTKKDFLKSFAKAGLVPPITHKAWFGDLTVKDVPNSVAFAFLDGDFYDSILVSLKLVWPVMVAGGCIVIDDYQRAALPGVERAVQQFFTGKLVDIKLEQQLAIIHNSRMP